MGQATVLVVEDEGIVGLELQEILESLGYHVPEIITSGDTVVEKVMKYKPKLIIMDIHLKSFIDGIDAVKRLKMIQDTPVIYLTAYPNTEIKDRAMSTNPAAYLLKPFREKELKEEIQKVMSA
ncbi:MAG: response regulator [Spirochaetales bacterium]|nr:response regulator [Spirochaetales bacterium]